MKKDYKWAAVAILLVVVAAYMAYSLFLSERLRHRDVEQAASQQQAPEIPVIDKEGAAQIPIKLFLYHSGEPIGSEQFLEEQERDVYKVDDPVLMARQILQELFKDPSPPEDVTNPDEEPPKPWVFTSVRLRHVYILDDGTAVIDLGFEQGQPFPRGIVTEMALIESVTRSLRANLPQIQQVRFLVEGRESDTLMGHISLARSFM
ncbi:MAG: GerMN domain-containing protein [Acidobacteriota bacterium]